MLHSKRSVERARANGEIFSVVALDEIIKSSIFGLKTVLKGNSDNTWVERVKRGFTSCQMTLIPDWDSNPQSLD